MQRISLKRLTNRLAHLSGLAATNHATLHSLCPLGARRCDDIGGLESSIDRHWYLTLKASETLQRSLQQLSDRLTAGDEVGHDDVEETDDQG